MRLFLLPVTNTRWCTSTTTITSRHRCKCFWSLQIAFLSYALLLLSAQAASTPTPTITPHHRSQPAPFDSRPFEQHRTSYDTPHHHQRRRPRPFPTPAPIPNPAPAQFWAGWPKETYTVIRTITQTEHGAAGAPLPEETTVVETAEVTTTLYDSNLPASGTLTVTSTTTLPLVAGAGGVGTITTTSTTTSTTGPSSSQSGTLTRTRTATIETRLPQETQWTPADIPRFAECLPGDEDYEEPGVLSLTKEQKPTLIALAIMFLVILIGWNFVIVRDLLYPLKMLVVLIHESGHIIGGTAAGRRLEAVHLDPKYGGLTVWETEIDSPYPLRWPPAALPLGYLMSALVGATLILCGFNTLASKVASFIVGLMMLVVAYNLRAAPVGLVLVAATVGLMIGFWFIEHAMYLRYYILFVGVMCCWYIIWDFIDDFVFHKLYSCCAVLQSEVLGSLAPFIWLYIYLAITALIFAGWLLIAIYVFRQSPHSMFCQGQSFLPT